MSDSTFRWTVITLLFALMVVNFVDRQIVVSMFPHLRASLQLSDGQLGLLVSIVSIAIAVCTVPASMLADRWGRVKCVVVMALVWSGATIACAFAHNYPTLLLARAVIGVAEAGYGPVAAALLTTLCAAQVRGTVLSGLYSAGLLGAILGVAVGGVSADRFGQEAGFLGAGAIGIVIAATLALVARDAADETPAPRAQTGTAAGILDVLKPSTVRFAALGAGLQIITVSMLFAWLPSFFNRYYGLEAGAAGLRAGALMLLSGVGAIGFGWLADRLQRRNARGRLMVATAAAAVTGGALTIGFGVIDPGPLQVALLAIGAVATLGTTGPISAAVADVVPAALRATAFAVLALAQNLVGLAVGPLLAGAVSDQLGLASAMAIASIASVVAALALVTSARRYSAAIAHPA